MKATSTCRQGYSKYGRRGYRSVDPTPEQIRQRAIEARQLGLSCPSRARLRQERQTDRLIDALRCRGVMNTPGLKEAIGESAKTCVSLLFSLVQTGVVVRLSGGASTAYTLPEFADSDSAPEIDLPSNESEFQRVTGRRFTAA